MLVTLVPFKESKPKDKQRYHVSLMLFVFLLNVCQTHQCKKAERLVPTLPNNLLLCTQTDINHNRICLKAPNIGLVFKQEL